MSGKAFIFVTSINRLKTAQFLPLFKSQIRRNMAAKIPTPDTVERPAAQKRESLKGLVFSDKTNNGYKIIIVHEEGGGATPGPVIYTAFSLSQNGPRVFSLTEWALNYGYKHRPEISANQIHPGGLTAETAAPTIQ